MNSLAYRFLALALGSIAPMSAHSSTSRPNPTELLRRSEHQLRGKTLEAKLSLTVVRGSEERRLEFKLWAQGTEKAVVKVLSPAKDRDTAHLRIGEKLWTYVPNVERVMKVAPSTMNQSWMGADFSNGDLVRSANLLRSYEHRLLGEETLELQGRPVRTWKIECTPRRNAPVPKGRIVLWIEPGRATQLRQEYYDANDRLSRTVSIGNLRKTGDHTLGTTWVVRIPEEPRNYTRVEYHTLVFDRPIPASVFTQEYLRKRVDD